MPYRQGFSPESIHHNIALFIREGYPQDQAVVMALDIARKAWRREHPRGKYPAHLKGMRGPRRRRRGRKGKRNRAEGGGYRVAFLLRGSRSVADGPPVSLAEAARAVRWYKRRGWTAWVETTDGQFVPVDGARRKPSDA